MKLFNSILKERLETQITYREEQQGFRRNRFHIHYQTTKRKINRI